MTPGIPRHAERNTMTTKQLSAEAFRHQVDDWCARQGQHPPAEIAEAQAMLREILQRYDELESRYQAISVVEPEIERLLAYFSALYDFCPIAYLTLGHDGCIQRTNLAGENLFGFHRSHLRERCLEEFLCEDSLSVFRKFLQQAFASQAEESCVIGLRATDRHPELSVQVIAVDDKEDQSCSIVLIDVTQRMEMERALLASERHFRELVEALPLGIAIVKDDLVKFINLQAMHMTGYLADELVGQRIGQLIRDSPSSGKSCPQRSSRPWLPNSYEAEVARKDGDLRYWRIHESKTYWNDELSTLMVFDDISAQKIAELKFKELSSIVEHSADAISLSTPAGVVRYANPAFERMSGYSSAEIVGSSYSILKSGKQYRNFYERLWATISHGSVFQGHVVNRRKDGRLYHVFKTISPIYDARGKLISYTSVDKDFDAEILVRQEIERLALHDSLTGLANRVLLTDRLEQAIARAVRQDSGFALFYIDLDDFKPINDLFGHECGDKVLREIARRLEEHRRETDTVARIGGDEFAILLQDTSSRSHAIKISREIIAAACQPIDLGKTQVRIGASIGISLFPANGEGVITLMRHADKAMYQAKNLGKNRAICHACWFDGTCDEECLEAIADQGNAPPNMPLS